MRNKNRIAILWNIQSDQNGFGKKYEAIKIKYGKDYEAIRKSHEPDLSDFFGRNSYKVIRFPHHIILDREGLQGLIQSSSFMPRTKDRHYHAMADELNILFEEYKENELLKIDYETHVHFS